MLYHPYWWYGWGLPDSFGLIFKSIQVFDKESNNLWVVIFRFLVQSLKTVTRVNKRQMVAWSEKTRVIVSSNNSRGPVSYISCILKLLLLPVNYYLCGDTVAFIFRVTKQ